MQLLNLIVPKMNYLVFVWITLLLQQTTGKVQLVRFFIVPSSDSPCPGEFTGDPCLTLIQYIRLTNPEPVVSSDVILDLQPGVHRVEVNTRLSVSGLNSFMMTGRNASFICPRPSWYYSSQSTGFTLASIADVHISGINFTDCQGNGITSVDNLIMKDCSFHTSSLTLQNVNATVVQTSFERSRGSVITLSGTSMRLDKCHFANNNRVVYARNAIVPSSLAVTNCNFTDNHVTNANDGPIRFEGGTFVTIRNSSFIRNNPEAVYIDGVNSLFISDSTFEASNNMNNIGSGAVYIANPSDSVVFLRCNFTSNSASIYRREDGGGAVRIRDGRGTCRNISFTECNFMSNSASTGGALYIDTSTNIPLLLSISVTRCNFTRNSASSNGGALSIDTSSISRPTISLNLTECNFIRNSASRSNGGALYIDSSTNIPISLSKCNFIENQGIHDRPSSATRGGGAVYISFTSRATTVLPISLTECNFSNNVAEDRGGALYLQVVNSLILVTHSYFADNKLQYASFDFDGNHGGAVYVTGSDNLISINGGAFINNTVTQGGGGALYSTGLRTNFSFVDVLFQYNSAGSTNNNFYGGAVYVSSGDNLISVNGGAFFYNSVVRGGGGALYSTGHRTNFSFVNVQFHNNSAAFCGVLEIEKFFHDSVTFSFSTFMNNRAIGGPGMAPNDIIYRGSGAICVRNASISVVNSTFSNNSALGNAGVMHIEGSSVEIVDSKFEHNEATLDGGVTYTKLSPNTFTIHRSTFLDNRAGDDGGVMYMGRGGSHVDVNESSFSLNHATDRGGVFVTLGSTLNIAESSFNDNTATRGDVINACISEINVDNVFETNSSSRTDCISYNNRPILPTEASTVATQTEETATTRSVVRRTAAIIVPPQTINPQTTAITPDNVTEETTTEIPSRVSTTKVPKTDSGANTTNTVAQTDSISTMGTTSQTEQEPTTNVPTESSTTTFQAEEHATTAAAGISTTSERTTSATSTQSEPTSMATGNSVTTGLQTEASTTVIPTMEEVHITTLPQADTTSFIETSTEGTVISQTEATSAPTDIHLTTANKDATDKLPSFTGDELSPTTNSLKGNSNAAGTILSLGSLGMLMISSAFTLVSV